MAKSQVQDRFLTSLVESGNDVVVYTINGFQVHGVIREFDEYVVVVVNSDNKPQMVYKSAISTIIPSVKKNMPDVKISIK